MVVSINGYIARLNGEEDFISSDNWKEFTAEVEECRNVVVGRKTYETVTRLYEDYNFDNVNAEYKVLVTGNKNYAPPNGFTVVHSPQEAVDFLESKGVETMYVEGGEINSSFATAGLVDELIVVMEPFLLGQGRPGMASGEYEFPLELIKLEKLSKDRVRLLYKVIKSKT